MLAGILGLLMAGILVYWYTWDAEGVLVIVSWYTWVADGIYWYTWDAEGVLVIVSWYTWVADGRTRFLPSCGGHRSHAAAAGDTAQ